MKKLSLILPLLVLLSSFVLADSDMMGNFDTMMGGSWMMGAGGWIPGSFFGLIYFAVISFVFSIIFWWTYKWIVKEKKK